MDKKTLEGLKFRMSPPVIMLVVALLIAGIVSYWSYGLLQKKSTAELSPADMQQVVVAAYEIKWGTVLTNELIRTQPYLKGSLPTGYLADPAAVVGRVVLYPTQVNQPILESNLAPLSVKGGGVAALVSPKKRAMGVKVDKVVGVAGFIHPGHRVDVLVSLPKSDASPRSITKVVLENILVLAVGTDTDQPGQKEKAAQVDVITLEVSPEEGEKLALAATEGKLQLALRNFSDTETAETRGATISALLTYQPEPQAPRTVKPVRITRDRSSSRITVELVKGNKVTETNFK
jgi:pilus assembly protein CpaB